MHDELYERFPTPGLSPDAAAELERRHPGLPDSYLRCLREVDVLDAPLGEFRLSLAEPAELEALGLIEVASAGGDSLCVERGGDGRVLWVRDEPVPREVASSFAELLVNLSRFDRAQWGDEPFEPVAVTEEQRDNLELLLGA
jgi:hypothetical protein